MDPQLSQHLEDLDVELGHLAIVVKALEEHPCDYPPETAATLLAAQQLAVLAKQNQVLVDLAVKKESE